MFQKLEKFLDALWPMRCIACQEISDLQVFCRYCEPSIRLAPSDALFLFSGPIRTSIHKAKFTPDESTARQLMRYVTKIFSKSQLDPNLEAIIFVPIHWRRRLSRGFDLSVLFAHMLSRQLHLPVLDWLCHARFSKPLSLTASRAERLSLTQNRYLLRKKSNPKRLLLVDDVMTTGATLESAQKTLTQAGHFVTCYALAKTPSILFQ